MNPENCSPAEAALPFVAEFAESLARWVGGDPEPSLVEDLIFAIAMQPELGAGLIQAAKARRRDYDAEMNACNPEG